MVYKFSNFWKNLKENGLVQALQLDWEETRKKHAKQRTPDGQELEEKISKSFQESKQSPLQEWVEGYYKFRLYGEWIQARLPSGNLGFLSEGLSTDYQKTGCKTKMLEVLDGKGHQYVLHSQPFENRNIVLLFNEELVFEYANEKKLVLKEGKFSEGPKKVFNEHHAYHKRMQRKDY